MSIILQIFYATCAVLKIGGYINNNLHLARKYARIFVCGHYLFQEVDIPQFWLGDIQSHDVFRPIAPERKDLMDYNLGYPPVLAGGYSVM